MVIVDVDVDAVVGNVVMAVGCPWSGWGGDNEMVAPLNCGDGGGGRTQVAS